MKPMHPSSPRAFQRYQARDRGTHGPGDLNITNKTKQNKQPACLKV